MNDLEIEAIYNSIQEFYDKYLKKKGVKRVNLKIQGQYTKNALVLVYLARFYPETTEVTKIELTKFIREYYPDTNDVQQARHLAKQMGYYIISGRRGDLNEDIGKDCYKLVSLVEPYRGHCKERRSGFDADTFEELKKEYNYRCATCGSKEGEPHNFRINEVTQLQAGHMNPAGALTRGNMIPQCQVCNIPD